LSKLSYGDLQICIAVEAPGNSASGMTSGELNCKLEFVVNQAPRCGDTIPGASIEFNKQRAHHDDVYCHMQQVQPGLVACDAFSLAA
jgi:hypothetical protein